MYNSGDLISQLPIDRNEQLNEQHNFILTKNFKPQTNYFDIDYTEFLVLSILLVLFSLKSVDEFILTILPEKIKSNYIVNAVKITLFVFLYAFITKIYLKSYS